MGGRALAQVGGAHLMMMMMPFCFHGRFTASSKEQGLREGGGGGRVLRGVPGYERPGVEPTYGVAFSSTCDSRALLARQQKAAGKSKTEKTENSHYAPPPPSRATLSSLSLGTTPSGADGKTPEASRGYSASPIGPIRHVSQGRGRSLQPQLTCAG